MITARAATERLIARLQRRGADIAARHATRIALAQARAGSSWRSAAALWPDLEQD